MTIDQVIKQSRMEAELLEKGYSLTDIYGKPERFVWTKKFTKRLFEAVFKISFFILLLYGVGTSLFYFNAYVESGQLDNIHIPYVAELKEAYHKLVPAGKHLPDGYADMVNDTTDDYVAPVSSSNSFVDGFLKEASKRFDGFMDIADESVESFE